MNEKDFDLDFDFEKEYGFDTPQSSDQPLDEDFDLKALLESEFGEEADTFVSEYESNFDYGPETEDYPPDEQEPVAAQSQPEEPAEVFESDGFDTELPEDMPVAESMPEEEGAEVADEPRQEPAQEEKPARRERRERKERRERREQPDGREGRKPLSPMRRFKNETMPLIITGVTALLILIFVIGSVSRLITNIRLNNEAAQKASEAAESEALRQEKEANDLLRDAAALAAGYDYDAAIAKLESFTGSKEKYPDIEIRLSEYKQQRSLLVAHNDPSAIPNLSFHMLIADPARAFSNRQWGGQYNRNFVTTDEFEKILEQLYTGGYVLVDFDSFVAETVTGDTITYSSKPLYLPDGKKPIMITETMVNYYAYMIDGNGDGIADKDGAGFASRLVLQNGEIKAEMVTATGETVVGNYDLVPILEDFIEEHPDFSYKGSRAILAVTGEEGIFGYRTNKSVIESKGQAYYDAQVAGAKEVVAALKEAGYEFASYTYANKKYGDFDATTIRTDITNWTSEVLPIIGSCDILVYAKESDISASGDYTGGKFNVLQEAGFRYFISNSSKPSCKIANNYVRQLRIMVTGTKMANAATTYKEWFDSQSLLNDLRGNVPQ